MNQRQYINSIKAEVDKLKQAGEYDTRLHSKYTANFQTAKQFFTGLVYKKRLYKRFLRSTYGFDVRRMKQRKDPLVCGTLEDVLIKAVELVDVYLFFEKCFSVALQSYRDLIKAGRNEAIAAEYAVKSVFEYKKASLPRRGRMVMYVQTLGYSPKQDDVFVLAAWVRTRIKTGSLRKRLTQTLETRFLDEDAETSLLEKLPGIVLTMLGLSDVEANELCVVADDLVNRVTAEIYLDRPVLHFAEDLLPKSQTSLRYELGKETKGTVYTEDASDDAPNDVNAPDAVKAARIFEEREAMLTTIKQVAKSKALPVRENTLLFLMLDDPDATSEQLATVMGVKAGTINSWKSRIRLRFRELHKN